MKHCLWPFYLALQLILMLSAHSQDLPTVNCYEFFPSRYPGQTLSCKFYTEPIMGGANRMMIAHFTEGWNNNPRLLKVLETVKMAVADSVDVYAKYTTVPETLFLLVDETHSGRLAEAETPSNREAADFEPCLVRIFLNIPDDEAKIKQTIAHEYAHCLMGHTMHPGASTQPIPGTVYYTSSWWEEGGAWFLSNLVYPNTNFEHHHAPFYHSDEPLHKQQDPNAAVIWFQYMENAGVPQSSFFYYLQSEVPDESTEERELMFLATMSDKAREHFHGFARALRDRKIKDTGGKEYPLPVLVDDEPIEVTPEAPQIALSTVPFTVSYDLVKFKSGTKVRLKLPRRFPETAKKRIRLSYRRLGTTEWKELGDDQVGDEVEVPCNSDGLYQFVYTSTAEQSTPVHFTVETSYQTIACACKDTLQPPDACLIGNWRLDLDSVKMSYERNSAGNVYNVVIKGGGLLGFQGNGHSRFDYETLIADLDLGTREHPMGHVHSETFGWLEYKVLMQGPGEICMRPVRWDGGVRSLTPIGRYDHTFTEVIAEQNKVGEPRYHYECDQRKLRVRAIHAGNLLWDYSFTRQ